MGHNCQQPGADTARLGNSIRPPKIHVWRLLPPLTGHWSISSTAHWPHVQSAIGTGTHNSYINRWCVLANLHVSNLVYLHFRFKPQSCESFSAIIQAQYGRRQASPTPPHVPNFSFLLDKPAASSCAPSLNCKLGHLFGAFKFNTSSNGTENVVPWPGRLLDMYYTPTARALPTEQQQAAAQPIYASRTQIIEIKFGQTKRMCGNPGWL